MEKVRLEPCNIRDKNYISIHWCVICEESLCSDCTENHRAMKMLRHHELIDISRMPTHTNIAEHFCFKHVKIPFEYFCIDHDVLSCKECLSESHRSCQKVMSVDIACEGVKQSQSFIDATELVHYVLETTHAITVDENGFIENILKEVNSVKMAVMTKKEEAISHIEALEKALLRDLDIKRGNILQKSKTRINETEDIEKKTKDKKDILDLVNKHGSEKQAFIAVHAYKKDLTDLEKRVTEITEKSTRFTIRLNPERLHKSIESIGSIELNEAPAVIKLVQKKKRQSQMPIVQHQSIPYFVYKRDLKLKSPEAFIFGMAVNEKEEVILVDYTRDRILVYDDNNKYKYKIYTKHQPWDIVLIPGKNLGVLTSHEGKELQFIDFDRQNRYRIVPVKDSHQGGGIAASKINIYVGTTGNIQILDLEGRFIRSIKIKNEACWFISLDTTGNIYYTTTNDLRCIRSDGTEVYTYSTPDDDLLWNLAVDNHGHVYVVVKKKGIYRLKPDGKFMDIVVKDEHEQSLNLIGICFNMEFTKMILSRGYTVSIFNRQ